MNPYDAEIYYSRGIAYYGMVVTRNDSSSLDLALEDFHQALRLNPDSAKVYATLGGTYLAKCDYERALVYFNRALQLNPGDSFTYCGRGCLYIIKDEYERGIKDLETSLRINPDDPEVRNYIEMARKMQKM